MKAYKFKKVASYRPNKEKKEMYFVRTRGSETTRNLLYFFRDRGESEKTFMLVRV